MADAGVGRRDDSDSVDINDPVLGFAPPAPIPPPPIPFVVVGRRAIWCPSVAVAATRNACAAGSTVYFGFPTFDISHNPDRYDYSSTNSLFNHRRYPLNSTAYALQGDGLQTPSCQSSLFNESLIALTHPPPIPTVSNWPVNYTAIILPPPSFKQPIHGFPPLASVRELSFGGGNTSGTEYKEMLLFDSFPNLRFLDLYGRFSGQGPPSLFSSQLVAPLQALLMPEKMGTNGCLHLGHCNTLITLCYPLNSRYRVGLTNHCLPPSVRYLYLPKVCRLDTSTDPNPGPFTFPNVVFIRAGDGFVLSCIRKAICQRVNIWHSFPALNGVHLVSFVPGNTVMDPLQVGIITTLDGNAILRERTQCGRLVQIMDAAITTCITTRRADEPEKYANEVQKLVDDFTINASTASLSYSLAFRESMQPITAAYRDYKTDYDRLMNDIRNFETNSRMAHNGRFSRVNGDRTVAEIDQSLRFETSHW